MCGFSNDRKPYVRRYTKHYYEPSLTLPELGAQLAPGKVCPVCGAPVVLRKGAYKMLFWGCSAWPQCLGSSPFGFTAVKDLVTATTNIVTNQLKRVRSRRTTTRKR